MEQLELWGLEYSQSFLSLFTCPKSNPGRSGVPGEPQKGHFALAAPPNASAHKANAPLAGQRG